MSDFPLDPGLAGLFVPIVTPMRAPDGEIDHDSLARFAAATAGTQGVSGLVTTARIGEGPLLTLDEQLAVASTVRGAVGPDTPVIATINPSTAAQARAQIAALAEAPATAVMIFPPLFLAWGSVPTAVRVRFFEDVAADTPLPIVLFQVPVRSYWYTPQQVRAISEIPGIVSMKEASFDMRLFTQTLEELEGSAKPITVLNGNDRFVAEGALLGAHGALIGIANVLPGLWAGILRHAVAGDAKAAVDLQRRLRPLQETIFGEPILDAVARIKAILQSEGLIADDYVRAPQLGIGAAERAELLDHYTKVKADLVG